MDNPAVRLGETLDTSEDRRRDEIRQNSEAQRAAAMVDILRSRRKYRGEKNLMHMLSMPQRYPAQIVFVCIIIMIIVSWAAYAYHLAYHRIFGNFTPHEQYLCREEPLMLQLQKLMLFKAKKEIAYMVSQAGTKDAAALLFKKREDESSSSLDSYAGIRFDTDESNQKASDAPNDEERIRRSQEIMRQQYADNIGPAHPKVDIHDHRAKSKIKGIQLAPLSEADESHPHGRVFVGNDLGFYQYCDYGQLHVGTESQSAQPFAHVGRGFNSIVYYRIWKNANDYVRGLLYTFARQKHVKEGVKHVCKNLQDCQYDSGTQAFSGSNLKKIMFPAHQRRFPFTFVRNPLTRFVSGYTEIEQRFTDARIEKQWWEEKAQQKQALASVEASSQRADHSMDQQISQAQRARERADGARQAEAFASATKILKSQQDKVTPKIAKTLHAGARTAGYDNFGTKSDADPLLAHKALPLKAPIGSPHRFLEFIDTILYFDGSRRIFKSYDASDELAHIAPQVGSLFFANSVEPLPIRMYKLEDFADGWRQLAEETGQTRLLQVRDVLKNHSKLWQHHSSEDALNTSRAAWSVLHRGLNITAVDLQRAEQLEQDRRIAESIEQEELRKMRERLGLSNADITAADKGLRTAPVKASAQRSVKDTVNESGYPFWLTLPQYLVPEVVYTRALCRIYLSDFVCGDYPLPPVCHDMQEEIDTFTLEYEKKQRARAWAHRSLANTILPQWLLHLLAEIPCSLFADSPPSCIAAFVHGDSLEEEDEYDEYDSDHDEL